MIFGKAPDGTMRVRMAKEGEKPNVEVLFLKKNTNMDGGKDSELISKTYRMWILK
jgi:hypothetical protein